MHMYYGEVPCPHCQKMNKALVENTCEPDAFYVPGDEVSNEETFLQNDIFCEYCYESFPVTVCLEAGRFIGFSNGSSICREGRDGHYQAVATTHYWETSFEEQPFALHSVMEVNGKAWRVQAIYKKEYNETDETKRMHQDFVNCYYYQVQNEQGDTYWVDVRDEDGENARLSTENPLLLNGETLVDVTDTLFKSHLLFCQEMGMQYDIEVYQHQSGLQLLLVRKEEEERVCVLDLFGDDLEALIARTEELLYARD